MKSSKWSGLAVGTLVLIAVLLLFGSPVNASWQNIPLKAINDIAFSLSFGLGLNHVVAYSAAIMTLAALFYIGYVVGERVFYKLR
ncbi:hypothetical protein QTO01_10740 [Vibrio mytili]|uniref:Uncharacterized protein n=1 Tax=Vibrio mytili TaxID=50718 RepID=A0A0C3HPT1_9VIBR|nr:hypothetical protein [Vibrio mytili]KIN10111.1 hypothetical protein SU60_15765 [Vibrio mytili]